MSEQMSTKQNQAREYQQKNRDQINTGLKKLDSNIRTKLDNPQFAVQSDFETAEDFNQFVESMAEAELLSNILSPVVDNIYFIKAGTGSGKTHTVLEAIKNQLIRTVDSKAVIATPTRAMAMDIQNTGNMKVSDGEDFVGLWIGGEGGKDIDTNDKVVAVTGGKLWDLLMKDPTLGSFDNPLVGPESEILSRKSNRDLEKVSTLIVDEADAMDARMIPAIKWLSTVRPDMKIIFVSATLNIEEFNNIYQPSPEAAFVAPEQERPRPISIDYINPKDAKNIGLTDRPKLKAYINAPQLVLDTWIKGKDAPEVKRSKEFEIDIPNEYPSLEPGESVIVFMPTIGSVEKLSLQIADRYGDIVEVRALHGRLNPDEIDKRLYEELQHHKIGIFVCTDVVGRGINFPDQFNINRTIDVGLRNRPQYDPITGREVLKVGVGTQADVLQGLGRAGRNTNDDRPVVGFVMQPQEQLYQGLTNHMVSNDPTQLILESAGMLKKIQDLDELPNEYKPSSLIGYLRTLDTNPKTSQQFEAKLNLSLNRLYGIQAIDGENNLTEFGEFLVKMKYPVDFGIMLFESLESPHLSKIIRIINLIDNLDYLESRSYGSQEKYAKLVGLFKEIYQDNIASDLQFYAKLMDQAEPYIDDYVRRADKLKSIGRPINRSQQEDKVKELFEQKSIDQLLEYIFKNDCGDQIGLDLDTLVSANRGVDRVYKNLDA
jgi:superfamily II DNA/RNA helicase